MANRFVVSGCQDQKIRVWKIDNSTTSPLPKEVTTLEGHTGMIKLANHDDQYSRRTDVSQVGTEDGDDGLGM